MLALGDWDLALWIGAGYLAATALVRLMIDNRRQWIERLQEEARLEQQRQAVERAKKRRLGDRRGERQDAA